MPSSARKPWFCCAAPSKGNAQSAETFRVVGTCATDSLNLRSSESNSGQRYAPCPLSFLASLKPFFSFWQRKKRMGSKNSPSLRGAQTAPSWPFRATNGRPYVPRRKYDRLRWGGHGPPEGPMLSSARMICIRATVSKTVGSGFRPLWAARPYCSRSSAISASAQRSPSTAADVMPPA